MKAKSILLASLAALATMAVSSCGGENENPKEGDKITVKAGDASFELVYVAPGNFRMGGTSEQEGVDNFNELPAHDVQLTKGYYIGLTEVTQEQWMAVMGSNPSQYQQFAGQDNDKLPVTDITWADAKQFVKKLSELSGREFRLPTEAEWEYAARDAANPVKHQYSGGKYVDNVACYSRNSDGVPHPVAQFMQNKLDMRDMCGNVAEWVEDNFEKYKDAFKDSTYVDPCIVTSDTLPHVSRGGHYASKASECRNASRMKCEADFASSIVGLRVVMDKK